MKNTRYRKGELIYVTRGVSERANYSVIFVASVVRGFDLWQEQENWLGERYPDPDDYLKANPNDAHDSFLEYLQGAGFIVLEPAREFSLHDLDF